MSEYDQGMNIFVRLPAELQRIVKQRLLDEFWVAIKTHRPSELLDDRPFYQLFREKDGVRGPHQPSYRSRSEVSIKDTHRIITMTTEKYDLEFLPPWRASCTIRGY